MDTSDFILQDEFKMSLGERRESYDCTRAALNLQPSNFYSNTKEVHQVVKIYIYIWIIMELDLACKILYYNEVDL